jgi:hypothetical protein
MKKSVTKFPFKTSAKCFRSIDASDSLGLADLFALARKRHTDGAGVMTPVTQSYHKRRSTGIVAVEP